MDIQKYEEIANELAIALNKLGKKSLEHKIVVELLIQLWERNEDQILDAIDL